VLKRAIATETNDAIVPHYEQILGAATSNMDKARICFEAEGKDPDSLIVMLRLRDEMEPLHFQIAVFTHHSLGALQGVQDGRFLALPPLPGPGYAGLQAHVVAAYEGSQKERRCDCG
jgi:hypothetical protein